MVEYIDKNNIEALTIGASLLGSGGGGSSHYGLKIAKYYLDTYQQAKIINITVLDDNDLILPLAYMGAPLVLQEKLPSGSEFITILNEFEKYFGKQPDAILPVEIGGANSVSPIIPSLINNIPILNGDLLGRAFPKLYMTSANLFNISPSPAFLADAQNNTVIVNANNSEKLEDIARSITVSCGSAIAIGMYVMNKKQACNAVIKNIISKAIKLGKILMNKKQALQKLQNATKNFRILCNGNIRDIDQSIRNGFLEGKVVINADHKYEVFYQNEYLVVYKENKSIACTPDIICILDQATLMPLTSDSLVYGLAVTVISFSTSKIWYTKKGLQLVGPSAFNIRN